MKMVDYQVVKYMSDTIKQQGYCYSDLIRSVMEKFNMPQIVARVFVNGDPKCYFDGKIYEA